ncbi:MAG: hypothetical protein HOI35_06830 [Woeseia sp.]|jgi:predicted metalloenzyme YecM|nr:hypothetical protein [Woeseia sp.]MBT6209718.1 hypothetical protein [Woeseia sp.]
MEMREAIGDYLGFFRQQLERLTQLGIDISGLPISHLAYRATTVDEYRTLRDAIEHHCCANVESVWNGRPISKLRLTGPLDLGDHFSTKIIELIPPGDRDAYPMGLEHVGIVVGDGIDTFYTEHREKLSGQQGQNAASEPYSIRFEEDRTTIKFYRHSLQKLCEIDGHTFDRFYHANEA